MTLYKDIKDIENKKIIINLIMHRFDTFPSFLKPFQYIQMFGDNHQIRCIWN